MDKIEQGKLYKCVEIKNGCCYMEDYNDNRYDEALERAKSAIKNCGDNKGRIAMIESIFPELKESEDERIRKDLLAFIKAPYVYDFIVHDRVDPWIAWIEKQGEQKSTAWSEWDEVRLNRIVANLELLNVADGDILLEDIDWLKSIKDRVKGKEEKK